MQFREVGGTVRSYTAIPIRAEGFEINSDGAHSRPELTIGNIGSVLSGAIGNTPLEDLVGKRLTRRTTLRKYLADGSGDTTPPIEYPKVIYILDPSIHLHTNSTEKTVHIPSNHTLSRGGGLTTLLFENYLQFKVYL